jgi:hypothetical protein
MSKEEKDLFANSEPEGLPARIPVQQEIDLISIPQKDEKSLMEIGKELDAIEKNFELFNRLKVIAIKLTKPTDWVIQSDGRGGQSPYLMDRGAENVAIAFGVDILPGIQLRQEWAVDDRGRYYTFISQGRAFSKKLNRFVEDIGVCSQRDKFFGKIGNEFKPIEDVDMANIRRKCITNLYNRLIKRVIGLMNLTIDDLKSAGFNIEAIPKIEYKTGAQKAEAQLSEIDLLKRDAIWKTCLQLVAGDEKSALDSLKYHSTFKGKDDQGKDKDIFVTSIKGLTTPRWINITFSNVKAAFKKQYPKEPFPFDEAKLK